MPVAENWTQLREKMRARVDSDLRSLARSEGSVAALADDGDGAWLGAFSGIGETASRCLLLAGPDVVRTHLRLDPLLEKLLEAGDPPSDAAAVELMAVIDYVAVARCVDHPLPGTATGLEARWFPQVVAQPPLYEAPRRRCAFAATAIGAPEAVPVFDQGARLKARSTTQTIVPMNTLGFARHLAECALGGGGLDSVTEPWAGYLRVFPIALAADGASWMDLFWAATSIMVRFEKRAPADVATWLPKLVTELD